MARTKTLTRSGVSHNASSFSVKPINKPTNPIKSTTKRNAKANSTAPAPLSPIRTPPSKVIKTTHTPPALSKSKSTRRLPIKKPVESELTKQTLLADIKHTLDDAPDVNGKQTTRVVRKALPRGNNTAVGSQRSQPKIATVETEADAPIYTTDEDPSISFFDIFAAQKYLSLWPRATKASHQKHLSDYVTLHRYSEPTEALFERLRVSHARETPERRHVDELRFFYANLEGLEETAFKELKERLRKTTEMRYQAAYFAAALANGKSFEQAKTFAESPDFAQCTLAELKAKEVNVLQESIRRYNEGPLWG